MDLNIIWFVLVGVLLTGYAILDGFDLGVGALHLFAKGDKERRILLNSIGPVWDGNEVWLVTGGGALFAAFPHVYASVFSAFYDAFMLLLLVLIFRAISIEFRSKYPSPKWRKNWDIAFSVSSYLIALLAGVALGNIVVGVPLDKNHELHTSVLDLITPYTVLVGITTVALFMMHGAIYLLMKTEGEIQARICVWVQNSMIFFIMCYVSLSMITLLYVPHMAEKLRQQPLFFLVALINMFAVANIPREITKNRPTNAFISSSVNILCLMGLFAIGLFPNIVPATDPANSLTIYNAASSTKTLNIMLIFALLGVPVVLAYTISIYWIYRGKVKLDEMSY
jgi:cytochrome d ubiquinol oxidase subunit II